MSLRGGTEKSRPDTIFALSTAPGRAGIAVVRISGPDADEALLTLTKDSLPDPRIATLRSLLDKANNVRIDTALCLRFVAPLSFTGENSIELQIHGGNAVIAAVLNELAKIRNFRLAEAGEFTKRALLNGKLDLTQAEGLADLIDAQTEAQRKLALRQMEGETGRLIENWRQRLLRGAAWFEADIDFSEDEIPPDAQDQSRAQLAEIHKEIENFLSDNRRGEILRDGFHIAVIGPPNAGKSSLVNALARRDVVIVSEIAGTTRDVVEVRLDLGGYPVIIADTAGLRHTEDAIEAEGVRRAEQRAELADFRLLLLDGSFSDPNPEGLKGDLTVYNKADLLEKVPDEGVWISTKTGQIGRAHV